MGRINWARVVLGGLLAGIISFLIEGALNGACLGKDWAAAMKVLGRDIESPGGEFKMIYFALWSLLFGFSAAWIYACIRPRFGPGPATAIKAGVMLWWIGYLLPSLIQFAFWLFPEKLIIVPLAVGLGESIVLALVAGWVYKES